MGRVRLRFASAALLLSFAAACGGSGGGSGEVVVTPANPGVAVSGTFQFAASVGGQAGGSVTWSIQEGVAGGSISSGGLYSAPSSPGVFHVVATSTSDGSKKGTSTAYVVPAAACTLPAPQPSALPAGQVVDLGVHAVGDTVTFDVPAGTGSVTLIQQGTELLGPQSIAIKGTSFTNTVVPATIKVNGQLYYDQSVAPPNDPANWTTSSGLGTMYFESAAPWTGSVTYPNTSSALEYVAANGGAPAGTWAVQVWDYAAGCFQPDCVTGDGTSTYPPGKYGLKALLKPAPVAATGTVDLTFYLVTDTLQMPSAETDPSVVRMVQTIRTYLGRAGITVGTPTFVDFPPAVKNKYARVDDSDASPCGDIATLLRMSQAGNRMNIFLVKSFTTATLVGMDGTIPGPASVGGTVASGALVSSANLAFGAGTNCGGAINLNGCGADFTAYIAAHETGHFLGLYHVTESFGSLFDPVKDTATCPCKTCKPALASRCYSGSGAIPSSSPEVNVADCITSAACGGGDNLMFWQLDRLLSTGSVSPQQASIMRANPLVRSEIP